MTVLEEVLLEEYQRTLRIKNALLAETEALPKGSLQKKKIKGKEYCYLQFRSGDSVKSMYVREAQIGEFQALINKRHDNVRSLKDLDKTLQQIERALGKEFIDEHTAERIR